MLRTMQMLITSFIFFTSGMCLQAQPTGEGGEVIQQVYEMLKGEPGQLKDVSARLQRAPWEALAYLEEKDSLQVSDLNEAVPDYYRFTADGLILKLINPENYNEYGVEIKTPYQVSPAGEVLLLDPQTSAVKDSWQIIYLDENYLALDMGDIRVFFTHTAPQE